MSYITSAWASVETMNQWAAVNSEYSGFATEFRNGIQNNVRNNDEPLYTVTIPDENIEYLKEMQELCNKAGAELLVVKIPAIGYPQQYSGAWTKDRSEKTRELCESLNITYLDLLYDCDIGINWSTDTGDGGQHLNFNGAKKVTEYLGKYIVSNYAVNEIEDVEWDKDLELYHKVSEVAHLQLEQDYIRYFSLLKEKFSDKTIFITACEDMVEGLSDEDIDSMRRGGLQSDFSENSYRCSFVAVMDQGEVIYEAMSSKAIDYTYDLSGHRIVLTSKGWNAGSVASVAIDDSEIAVNGAGINIVVFDPDKELVLDSVCFDTRQENHYCTRNSSKIWDYMNAFEAYVVDTNR